MSSLPNVSVIIPCRLEENYIGGCLDSIIANDYPKEKLAVLVVDGISEDGTRKIIESYTKRYPFIRLLDNKKKIIPAAMNLGIKNSECEIIMKIDSHTIYARDYISKCIRYLIKYNADNVGGVIIAIPRNNTSIGKAIVLSLSHPFGVGNSLFRIGTKEPIWNDTAFSGCYRKKVFNQIGLYDENIARSEDVAINSKLRRTGGKILLVPEIVSYYYARSNFCDFIKHNFDNGFWITYPLKIGSLLFSFRHLVPLIFVTSLLGSAVFSFFSPVFLYSLIIVSCFYIVTNLYFSAKITLKEKNIKYLFLMPVVFASLHISYGLGSIWGVLKVLSSKHFWKNIFIVRQFS